MKSIIILRHINSLLTKEKLFFLDKVIDIQSNKINLIF